MSQGVVKTLVFKHIELEETQRSQGLPTKRVTVEHVCTDYSSWRSLEAPKLLNTYGAFDWLLIWRHFSEKPSGGALWN